MLSNILRAFAPKPAPTPPSADLDSRRRHSRVAVNLEVTMESESNFYSGFSMNLSEGGLFVATHDYQQIGAQLQVTLSLPDGDEPIIASCVVRWVREYNPIIPDMIPGMGVQFVQLTPFELNRIEQFCKGLRDPLFYDDL
jgi:uncharacterized protein (TIGR02266 family)